MDGIVADPAAATESKRSPRHRACRVCGGPLDTPTARVIGRCEDCPGAEDPELVAALRAWRNDTAKDNSVPAYVIFTDATLQALAENNPRTEAELLSISGFGPVKVERFGAEVLQIIQDYT